MTKENEFISTLEDELTPDQVESLIHGDDKQGDTGKPDANDSVPDTDDTKKDGNKSDDNADDGSQQSQDDLNADNAVILAKDGKHTISYEKLVEARQQAQQAKQQAAEASQETERLRQEAQQRKDAGEEPTSQDKQVETAEAAIEAGVDPDLFGDFSEEALAKGIQALVSQQIEQRIESAMQPMKERELEEATSGHYATIYEAHPDADSLVESQEMADWVRAQPSFMQQSMQKVLEDGSTEEVIELFNAFKTATGTHNPVADDAPKADDIKQAANKRVAEAENKAPSSLSDFPAGRTGATSKADAMSEMDADNLVEAMDDMTPDQIERYLNRL